MSNAKQTNLGLTDTSPIEKVEEYRFEPIKGYPILNWRGKRLFTSTHYYPAQLRETHSSEVENWRNKIYWGDNLQVMSHLLKDFRGKVKLVYIDPPFDSKADYKKKIKLRGHTIANDLNAFEEKQYTDIWTNDEYLQFMYERLILVKELLSADGSLYLHCDWHKSHFLRCMLDEIFGEDNFQNEIIWQRFNFHADANKFGVVHDSILFYTKTQNYVFNKPYVKLHQRYIDSHFTQDEDGRYYTLDNPTAPGHGKTGQALKFNGKLIAPSEGTMWRFKQELFDEMVSQGKVIFTSTGRPRIKRYLDEIQGSAVHTVWTDISSVNSQADDRTDYPTQKPIELLTRIINASSLPGDLIMDCFMGSGTTQEVALTLGRKFIGTDINLGAVQITTKRLLSKTEELQQISEQAELFAEKDESTPDTFYTGFEVYNVNHYDVFRNPIEARELLLEALEVNKLPQGQLFDGEKDGRMFKIMPVNRIASRADLGELIAGLDLKAFAKRQKSNPSEPVEKITLVCMGHEPDLKASLMKEADPYKLDVEVVDILRDRQDLQFKRDSEAKVVIAKGKLVIERFYPMNLLGKLSLQKEKVKDWKELVESVMIDWNYDGAVLTPTTVDIPEKDELVSGAYPIPKDAGTIRIKITDLLSESLEVEVTNG